MWEKLATTLEHPEWLEDPRFAEGMARVEHRDALTEEMEEVLADQDVAVWVDRFNAAGVPCGPVLDIEQVFRDPQVLAREMLVEFPHPEVGSFRTTGLPVKLSANPGRIRGRPPLHGEHGREILVELGFSPDDISAYERRGAI